MTQSTPLNLYEQVLLLALCNPTGTLEGHCVEYGLAGALLAQLQWAGRLGPLPEDSSRVAVLDATPLGDPLLDECLQRIVDGKKPRTWKEWVSRITGLPQLRHRAADRLVEHGVLRADEKTILLIFRRKVYPELNPKPEALLREELRRTLFEDVPEVSPEMATLVALCHSCGLLAVQFGKQEIKARRDHIQSIIAGDKLGKATQEAIHTLQTAVLVGALIPIIVT